MKRTGFSAIAFLLLLAATGCGGGGGGSSTAGDCVVGQSEVGECRVS